MAGSAARLTAAIECHCETVGAPQEYLQGRPMAGWAARLQPRLNPIARLWEHPKSICKAGLWQVGLHGFQPRLNTIARLWERLQPRLNAIARLNRG